jgi:hypothetical protein
MSPICHEAQVGTGLQNACKLSDKLILDQAPLPMPRLRPGIGEQNVDAIQRCIRQLRQHIARVTVMQAHVLNASLFDVAQTRGDAVEEWLDALPEALRGQCCAPLRDLPVARLDELLHQAALVRFQGKAERLQARSEAGRF